MTEHTCNQADRILTLELNHKTMANDVSEIKSDVKEIKKTLDGLGDKLDKKYSTKEEVKQTQELQDIRNAEMKGNIDKHQAVIDRLARAIVMGVIVFVGSACLLVYSLFAN